VSFSRVCNFWAHLGFLWTQSITYLAIKNEDIKKKERKKNQNQQQLLQKKTKKQTNKKMEIPVSLSGTACRAPPTFLSSSAAIRIIQPTPEKTWQNQI
jgi:hypothetical protein